MESTSVVYNELLKLLNLNEKDKLSLAFYLTRHVNQDEKYKSVKYDVSEELTSWLLENIISEVTFSENTEVTQINVTNYEDEFSISDSVAELVLSNNVYSDIKSLNEKINISLSSAKTNEFIIKSNFQSIVITNDNEKCIVCFYRGLKKSGKRKKYLGIVAGNLCENNEAFFDVGGNLSFIIYKDRIFIFRVKDFEYAYKYTSHVTNKRDENIENIINLNLFADKDSVENFRSSSNNFLFARGIASMDDDQINDFKDNYNDRCSELKAIKDKLDLDSTVEEELRKENGILIDLLKFIDFENENKICISEEMNIKPVLHFLQDKIVESFLTKKVKTIIGYQKG
ncbi:Kiwa anti-phage protein KwaB-like domain-containing protein [Vagococcus fluvialis]|uniref:Kiwa anti-phage protein KwaB-like domain-containing protein n=1 Tax=Vagococcus fluvialis TaxID=2738 RepID=UPI0022E364D2|nr:Kiwa anti-phage protein KwaB-like domain-containing protein [Vagococcus fluvialis]